jgi:hypothetical protein
MINAANCLEEAGSDARRVTALLQPCDLFLIADTRSLRIVKVGGCFAGLTMVVGRLRCCRHIVRKKDMMKT